MSGPLSGLKVLDFTTLLPGPYATQLLADMGADVLRIEAPKRPDLLRNMAPMVGECSAAHATINRNKKTIALDLKQPAAIEIVHKLLADYDIVIEQFRPGVMQRFGLDYDTLSAINPKLIYCAITGYGQTGELSDRAGHDINYLALSGLASFSGRQDTGPVLSGTQIADIAGGSHHAVMGILAAVIERQGSGKGQAIDISMSDAALALTTMFSASYLAGGHLPGLATEWLNGGIFYDYYQTADGRYLSVGSLEPQFASGLFNAIGKPEWLARAADQSAENQQALRTDLQAVFASRPLAEWQALFAELDVCVEPVLTLEETRQHPHFNEREMFVEVPHGEGSLPQLGSPLKFSGSKPQYRRSGAALGADTDSLLSEYGLSQQELDELREKGVIL